MLAFVRPLLTAVAAVLLVTFGYQLGADSGNHGTTMIDSSGAIAEADLIDLYEMRDVIESWEMTADAELEPGFQAISAADETWIDEDSDGRPGVDDVAPDELRFGLVDAGRGSGASRAASQLRVSEQEPGKQEPEKDKSAKRPNADSQSERKRGEGRPRMSREEAQRWWEGLSEEEKKKARDRMKRYREMKPEAQKELARANRAIAYGRQGKSLPR